MVAESLSSTDYITYTRRNIPIYTRTTLALNGIVPFPSNDCNRLLANVGFEGDHLARRCNLERLDGRLADCFGNGVRETLVYRSENGDCDKINNCGDILLNQTYADVL